MARPSASGRNLSLTEELERLEQSITLTLQEIDHNFSKSHRIVTTSILPLVEQYGENSRAVWEASKFWKQFFEASANVSLSGYEEEQGNDQESTVADESTALRDDTEADYTARHEGDVSTATGGVNESALQGDESLLDDAELSGSTPRPPATKIVKTQLASLESPYESMKRAMEADTGGGDTTVLRDSDPDSDEGDGDEEDTSVLFAQRTARLPDMSMTPRDRSQGQMSLDRSTQKSKDPLLHRILDKSYRIQATPHKPALRISPFKGGGLDNGKGKGKGGDSDATPAVPSWQQDSPASSPEMAVPKLRSEAFMSPIKASRQRAQAANQGPPRTPGVSVQTPGTARKTRDVFADEDDADQKFEMDWDIGEPVDDDDLDLYAGMSPPKTIQFALPPSKLLQTPAREASKRIVDNILLDAGADLESSEYSPTMVKMNADILDDSF